MATRARPPMGVQIVWPTITATVLRDFLPFPTLLGLGALLQYVLTALPLGLPHAASWVIPAALILLPFATDVLLYFRLIENPWTKDVVPGRTFAKLGEGVNGPREYCIFSIGARRVLDFERGIAVTLMTGCLLGIHQQVQRSLWGLQHPCPPPLQEVPTGAPHLPPHFERK